MSLSETALPFDDIRNLVKSMPGPDEDALARVKARDAELTKPAGSLGRLEEIAEWLAAWSGKAPPKITRPMVGIFATAHGVADEGVSAFPSAVNRQMVENFAAGGAAINQICRAYDIGLKVFDLAVDMPTPSITREDAMDEANCAATMAYGMEALAGGIDLICLGEMGIGNTTVAAAVINALFGGKAEDWIGRGTGVDDEGLARKRDAVEKAVAEARRIDEESMAKHNREATVISMILGFTTLALFVDGLLRMLGIIPPFMDLDVNILDKIETDIVDKIKQVPVQKLFQHGFR